MLTPNFFPIHVDFQPLLMPWYDAEIPCLIFRPRYRRCCRNYSFNTLGGQLLCFPLHCVIHILIHWIHYCCSHEQDNICVFLSNSPELFLSRLFRHCNHRPKFLLISSFDTVTIILFIFYYPHHTTYMSHLLNLCINFPVSPPPSPFLS